MGCDRSIECWVLAQSPSKSVFNTIPRFPRTTHRTTLLRSLQTTRITYNTKGEPQMSSMQAYLASKYMSGPKADAILARASTSSTVPKKKKKRRDVTEAEVSLGGSFIKDDDELRWGKPMEVDDENEGTPVVEKDRSFKKRKVDPAAQEGGAGWITIRGGDAEDGEDADTQPTGDVAPKFVGGLVPASELQTVLPQSSAKRKGKGRETSDEPPPEAQETVYRDASGRKIDMKLEKAAAAREKRLREEKESAKMEWGKGLVQREEADRLKREEEAEKTRGLARQALRITLMFPYVT